jgi:hypothetical protein
MAAVRNPEDGVSTNPKTYTILSTYYVTQTHSVAINPQENYTNRTTAKAGEVSDEFYGRVCCVVSAMNPYGR